MYASAGMCRLMCLICLGNLSKKNVIFKFESCLVWLSFSVCCAFELVGEFSLSFLCLLSDSNDVTTVSSSDFES